MRVLRKVELIAIGDELLNGLRTNSHLVYLGDQLHRIGLTLAWACEIRDEPADILAATELALSRADLAIITGGLGPTRDDCTAECVASALRRPLVHDVGVEAAIREFFRKRNRKPTDCNWKQCSIIKGAEVLPNPNGTAPGQWIESGDQLLVLLPGPPLEMKPMYQEQVVPRLEGRKWVNPVNVPLEIRTMGVGESQVADLLEPVFAPEGDNLRVAYCVQQGYVDIRVSPSGEHIDKARMRAIADACRERLGPGFLGFGTPDVACVILQQLRQLNKSLAVAESCTGGLLASRFTDIAGASKVFRGGLVCYNNEIKEAILGVPGCLLNQHGAVSAECAVAMATAVAETMESDYALSITGYAGPEGGNEPAGTVYLGYYSPVGVWSRKVELPGNRIAVKERAVLAALDFMRRKLAKYQMYDLLESLKC